MMRVLVTGSSGLVGKEVTRQLAAAGFEAVAFDLQENRLSVTRREDLMQAMAGCSGVIHLAAVSRVAWGEADPVLCRLVNEIGTDLVCEAALAQAVQPWLIFASSREVYGDPVVFPVSEAAAVAPVNHYGRSKAGGERSVAAAASRGLRTAVLRLSNVYGGLNDHPDRAVPSLLWRAMQGDVLRLSGRDGFSDFVHVADTARGFVLAAQRLARGAPGLPVLHLATGVASSLGALADMAIDVTGSASRIEVQPVRSFDVKGFCGDPARAAEVLDWRAEISLRQGMARLHALLLARGRPLPSVDMPQLDLQQV